MNKRKKIFFFVSRDVVYNDKFIPIVLHLADQGCIVETIFLTKKDEYRLKVFLPYYKWLENYTNIRVISHGQGVKGKLIKLLNYLLLLLKLFFSKNYISFFDTKGKVAGKIRILSKISNIKGRSILYSHSYEDEFGKEDRERMDLLLQHESYREKFHKSSISAEESSRLRNLTHKCGSLILYNSYDNKDSVPHIDGCNNIIVVNYPKLQLWWREFLNNNPPIYDNDRVQISKKYIPIFLTHFGNYLFHDDIDLDNLVYDIIKAIRQAYPKVLIVLKPKYSVNMDRLNVFINTLNDDNIVTSHVPTSCLSYNAICGITTCHTTAQFEFASEDGPPWIEYCLYSKFWKDVYPKTTYTERYGGLFVEDYDSLCNILNSIERFKYDFSKFKNNSSVSSDINNQSIDFNYFYNF